jgi:hypothetical protein
MAEAEPRVSIAQLVEKSLGCPPKLLDTLSESEREALHTFKHRLVGSLHRLYEAMPADQADEIISKPLQDIVAKLR